MNHNLVEKHANGVSKEHAISAGLPKRWKYCPKFGSIIQGRFLPFKTPLSDAYDELLEDKTRFYPQEIFDTSFEGGKDGAKVKLWFNLAYTERFYGWKAVTSNDCEYRHIPLRGHEETPSDEDVVQFTEIVNEFIKDHPNDIIAVHCTHGFNRTGFLIAAYLIKTMGWNVEAAVKEFAKARPNGIYKEDYLQELYRRYDTSYNPDVGLPFEAPGRPEWDNVEEEMSQLDLNRKPRFNNAKVRGVDHVDDPEKREVLLKELRKILQPFSTADLETSNFISTQPVSLDRQNISLLASCPYSVSWKADGIRYLIFIKGEDEVYAFDRDKNIFKLPLKFPRKNPLNQHVTNTVIEVDMVTEKSVVGEKTWFNNKMFISDVMIYGGREIGKEVYQKRYDAINNFLIYPRSHAVKQGLMGKEPIYVYRKEVYNILKCEELLSPEFAEKHRNKGLIFQPNDEPYTCGSFPNLLEWNFKNMMSKEFLIEFIKENGLKESPLKQWYDKRNGPRNVNSQKG